MTVSLKESSKVYNFLIITDIYWETLLKYFLKHSLLSEEIMNDPMSIYQNYKFITTWKSVVVEIWHKIQNFQL